MIRISQVVKDIIASDEIAVEALRSGILNLSAYADKILPLVSNKLFKDIKKGSIVTALSRLSLSLTDAPSLRAEVHIEDMSIKSPLSELTFEKTKEASKKVLHLGTKYFGKGFFTSTQGIGEITIIVSESIKKEVLENFGVKPKGFYDNLAAVTVRFIENEYIEVPNMIYTLISVLASKRINIIEIVSTFTEISFVVRQKDLKEAVDILKNNFLS